MYCPIVKGECLSSCVMREAEGGSVCIFLRAAEALIGIEEVMHDISVSLNGIDANTRDIVFAIEKK